MVARSIVTNTSWFLLFLVATLLALRWVERLWIALLLGAMLPMLSIRALGPISWTTFDPSYPPIVLWLFDTPYRLLQAALFVGLFLAALQISRPKKGRLSKRFYLVSILGGWVLGLLLLLFWLLSRSFGYTGFSASFALPGLWIVGTYTCVAMALLTYKMWAAIQDGHARATPGKAVGLLFVPLYNLYWAFHAFWGFSKDYNSYLQRHGLKALKLRPGLFLAYVVLVFLGFVPKVSLLVIAANILVGAAMIGEICDAINALPATPLPAPVHVNNLLSGIGDAVKTVAIGEAPSPGRDPDAVSYCPKCHCPYREGFSVCADCGIPLVKYAA